MTQVFDFLEISEYKDNSYQNTFRGQYSSMDESLKQALTEYYRPHNEKLEEFLGMNFNWC